jgi:hypothetical protein
VLGLKRFRVRTTYNEMIRPYVQRMFEDIDTIIIRQQFTTSPRDFLVLCEVLWKKRMEDPLARLKELAAGIEWFEEIIIISSGGIRTLCFVKGVYDKVYTELFLHTTREFRCFIEYPITARRDFGLINLVGPPKDVLRLQEFMRGWGAMFETVAITDYHGRDVGVATALTGKQLAVLRHAYRKGFFDNPRKADARKLSEQLGIRHTTFLTHLRKGQKRILDELFRD